MNPQCDCGRFMTILGARNNKAEGYANSWYAIGACVKHGEQPIEWEWLGDFDPEAATP